jgi:hypothetical protein
LVDIAGGFVGKARDLVDGEHARKVGQN